MGVSKSRIDEINKYLTKEVLTDLYLKQGLSAYYIATKYFAPDFTCDTSVVISRLKKLNIKTRNVAESAAQDKRKEEHKNTCKSKYGVDNVSQFHEVKEKKEKLAIEKYGVKNVFQSEEIKNKAKSTMLKKYGFEHSIYFRAKHNGFISNVHKKIELILNDLKIEYVSDCRKQKFLKFNSNLNKSYSPCPDILIENLKVVIECYGNYWHANPKLYQPNDIIAKYEGNTLAKDIWNFDKIRKEHIESFGYKVYEIWEDDINNNFELVKEQIYEICKN